VLNLVSRGVLRYKVLTGSDVPEEPILVLADDEPF
jgi:hypothetical protein